jgi:hypothetical protein
MSEVNDIRAEIQDAASGFLTVTLVDGVPMVPVQGISTFVHGIAMAVALNAIANPSPEADGQVKVALLFADMSDTLTAKAEVEAL